MGVFIRMSTMILSCFEFKFYDTILFQFRKAKLRPPTGQRLSNVGKQQKTISIGPILFLCYKETLVSSNWIQNNLGFMVSDLMFIQSIGSLNCKDTKIAMGEVQFCSTWFTHSFWGICRCGWPLKRLKWKKNLWEWVKFEWNGTPQPQVEWLDFVI